MTTAEEILREVREDLFWLGKNSAHAYARGDTLMRKVADDAAEAIHAKIDAHLAAPATEGQPYAWSIEYASKGAPVRQLSFHNTVGDYRMLDPDAKSIPLFTAAPGGSK